MYEDRYEDGKRSAWEFEYTGHSLAPTTFSRMEYHAGRQKYWDEQSKLIEQDIRDKGVKLTEQSVTGGKRFVATVDNALGDRLSEARGKSDRHRSIKESLEAYLFEFNRTPDRMFSLKLADLKFFGLVGTTTVFGDNEIES